MYNEHELYQFIGKQIKITNRAYISKKAPPPFLAALTGNPTKLPIPTAEPAAAKIKPSLELKCSLFILITTLFNM